MIEKAGFWRRALAALVDLIATQILFLVLVAAAFQLTGGRVTTSYGVYKTCRTTEIRPDQVSLPTGVVLPRGFTPDHQGLCWSSLFNWTTRVAFVATREERQGNIVTKRTEAYSVDPQGDAAMRVFDTDVLFLPLFVLLRWAADRFARGSPGRRLARIAVTDAVAGATGATLAPDLARRYARFVWPLLPGIALQALAAIWSLMTGSPPVLATTLAWICGPTLSLAAVLAAAAAIVRHADAFYDAPVGTVVAPRFEIECCEVGPAARRDPRATVWTDAAAGLFHAVRSAPRVTLALIGLATTVFAAEWWLPATPAGPDGIVSVPTRLAYGGVDRELVLELGQVYRLFSSMFLHASLTHLAANMSALLVAGYLVETVIGRRLTVILFLAAGLAASAASVTFNSAQEVAVGASGAVLGVLAASLVLYRRVAPGPRRVWMRAVPIALIFPSFVQAPAAWGGLPIDIAAHAGGVAGGLAMAIGIVLAWRGEAAPRPTRRFMLAGGTLVAAVALLPVPVTGWRDPVLAAHLVPPDEMPPDDAGWRDRGPELAARYPEDPRAALGLAMREASTDDKEAALRDLDRAIALQRGLAPSQSANFRSFARLEIGGEFFGAGDLDAAVSQYDAGLAEQPAAAAYRQRGIAEFYLRRPQEALADLRQAVALAPKDGYAVLWLSIVAARSGAPDPIRATAAEVRDTGWPDRIVAFFDGKTDAAAMSAWASMMDIASNKHRVCEAVFYEGEHMIMQGRDGPARPLLEQAARICPHDFIEYAAAREELSGKAGVSLN